MPPQPVCHLTMATDIVKETQYNFLSFKYCMKYTVQKLGNLKCTIHLSEIFRN